MLAEKCDIQLTSIAEGGMEMSKGSFVRMSMSCQLLIGDLTLCHIRSHSLLRSEEDGRYLYVMDQAVSAFASGHSVETSGVGPVSPCILPWESDGCQMSLEIEDKGTKAALQKISADGIRVSITNSITHEQANSEILKLFGKILGRRLTQIRVERGPSTRHKLLFVQDLSIYEVGLISGSQIDLYTQAHDKLQAVKPIEKIEISKPESLP